MGRLLFEIDLLTVHEPQQGGRAVSALAVRSPTTLLLRRDAAAIFVGFMEGRARRSIRSTACALKGWSLGRRTCVSHRFARV